MRAGARLDGRSLVLAAFVAFAGPLDLLTRFARRSSPSSNNIRQQRGIDLGDLVFQLQLALLEPRQGQLIAA